MGTPPAPVCRSVLPAATNTAEHGSLKRLPHRRAEREMGCLPSTYETPRIARVPSKALATASTCLTFSVLAFYMLGFVVLYQKKYLALESPDGTARLQLENPTPDLLVDETSQLSYCNGGTPAAGQIPNVQTNYTGELALTRPCRALTSNLCRCL